jgi:hypothetical protein
MDDLERAIQKAIANNDIPGCVLEATNRDGITFFQSISHLSSYISVLNNETQAPSATPKPSAPAPSANPRPNCPSNPTP